MGQEEAQVTRRKQTKTSSVDVGNSNGKSEVSVRLQKPIERPTNAVRPTHRNPTLTGSLPYHTTKTQRKTAADKTPKTSKQNETPRMTERSRTEDRESTLPKTPKHNGTRKTPRKTVGKNTRKDPTPATLTANQSLVPEEIIKDKAGRTTSVRSEKESNKAEGIQQRKTTGQKEPRNPKLAQALLSRQLRAEAATTSNDAAEKTKDATSPHALYESSDDDDGCFNFASKPYSAGNIMRRMGNPDLFDSDSSFELFDTESSVGDLPKNDTADGRTARNGTTSAPQAADNKEITVDNSRMQVGAKSPRDWGNSLQILKQKIKERKRALNESDDDSSTTVTDLGSLHSLSKEQQDPNHDKDASIGDNNGGVTLPRVYSSDAGSTISVPEHDGSAISVPQKAHSEKTTERKTKKGNTTPRTKNGPTKNKDKSKTAGNREKQITQQKGNTSRKSTKGRNKKTQSTQIPTTTAKSSEHPLKTTTNDVGNQNETGDGLFSTTTDEIPKKDGCDYKHDDYDIGTMYYAIEDPKELLFVLNGLHCKLCDIAYGREQGKWKPGAKTPVYACRGMRCGEPACEWAVCGNCFGKEQKKRVDETTSVRTRRRT